MEEPGNWDLRPGLGIWYLGLGTMGKLHAKADVKGDVEPIADVEKIQTKTKT